MRPFFFNGDRVIVEKTPLELLQPGQVILFTRGKKKIPILHRIVHINVEGPNRTFITQGDNNPFPDRPNFEGQIKGRIGFRLKKKRLKPISPIEERFAIHFAPIFRFGKNLFKRLLALFAPCLASFFLKRQIHFALPGQHNSRTDIFINNWKIATRIHRENQTIFWFHPVFRGKNLEKTLFSD